MAVRADAGENSIVFRYRTPYLTEGMVISAAGLLLLALYLLICRKFLRGDKDYPHKHCYDYDFCWSAR